jgi:hypothetical protein
MKKFLFDKQMIFTVFSSKSKESGNLLDNII